MRPLNIYLSSSWKQRERVRAMAIALRKHGFTVYDFTDPECRRAPELPPERFPEQFDPAKHRYGAYLRGNPNFAPAVFGNRDAILAADLVLLMLPCGNDAHSDWAFGVGTGALSCIVGRPVAGDRTPTHLWATDFADTDEEAIEWCLSQARHDGV